MGGGLAFLTKKSFNPANWSNQRQVWEARQKAAQEQRRVSEREAQLKREREEEEMARLVGEEEGGRKQLGFMYDGGRVPGLKREKEVEAESDSNVKVAGSESLYERQPGDDDAAAAFRAMLARGTEEETAPSQPSAETAEQPADEQRETTTEHKDHRTALEKAVGRGIHSGSGVTLAQQMERFPMLKGAPMVLQKPQEGEAEKDPSTATGLNFKPLGQVIRNVKCMACGKWGHSRGERECSVSGWDPFASAPTASLAAAPAKTAPVASVDKPHEPTSNLEPVKESTEIHNSDRRKRKKEKRRHKDEKKKRKRRHKRRSYSSDSSSDSSEESEHRHRKESRRHKRRRERSRSPCSSVSRERDERKRRHRDDGRERIRDR